MFLFLIFLESSRRSDIFVGDVWAQIRLNHYPTTTPVGRSGVWGGHQAIPIEGTLSQSGRPYPKGSSKLTLDELHLEI